MYQGPPTSAADWPLGAVESGEIVIDAEAVAPELLVDVLAGRVAGRTRRPRVGRRGIRAGGVGAAAAAEAVQRREVGERDAAMPEPSAAGRIQGERAGARGRNRAWWSRAPVLPSALTGCGRRRGGGRRRSARSSRSSRRRTEAGGPEVLPTRSETRVAVAVAGVALDGRVGAAGQRDRARPPKCRSCRLRGSPTTARRCRSRSRRPEPVSLPCRSSGHRSGRVPGAADEAGRLPRRRGRIGARGSMSRSASQPGAVRGGDRRRAERGRAGGPAVVGRRAYGLEVSFRRSTWPAARTGDVGEGDLAMPDWRRSRSRSR